MKAIVYAARISVASAIMITIPSMSLATMGDNPPCDPRILGQANVFFDFSMESHADAIDQSACAAAGSYFSDGNQSECYVFPGGDFEMVTDEMRAANAPFGGLVIRAPDASVLGEGNLFLDGEQPLSDKMFIEISPSFGVGN